MSYQRCPLCKGKGTIKKEVCPTCTGEKIISRDTGLPPSRIQLWPSYPYYPVYPTYTSYPYNPPYYVTCGSGSTGVLSFNPNLTGTTTVIPPILG